jgi:hypothetical protein
VVERSKKDSRGLLQALLGFGDRSARRRETIIDLLLMAGLADGSLSLIDEDRIARAIQSQSELQGFDWDDLVDRIEIIQSDAPLFSETRARLVRDLDDAEARRSALSLTSRFLGSPLGHEELVLLSALADAFQIPVGEREVLLAPWTEADPFQLGYVRCSFNNPEAPRRQTLFEAMERTESDPELALLTFKLTAARVALTKLSEDAELIALGELIDLGGESFRVDALLQAQDRSFLARFLGKGEAMYPGERLLLEALVERLNPGASLLIGHADPALAPPDEAAFRKLRPGSAITERVEF